MNTLKDFIKFLNENGVTIELRAPGDIRMHKEGICIYSNWDGTTCIEFDKDVNSRDIILMVSRYKEMVELMEVAK